jgi:hypothetical protein
LPNPAVRRLTTNTVTFPWMLLLIGAAGLAGCTQHPKVSSTWSEGAARGQAYSTILVVGVSPNLSQRCAFERVLASRLRSESTLVATSCDALKPKDPLTRAGVEAAVEELGIDAVIATLLVGKNVSADDGGSRDTRGGAMYKATDSGWAYGWDGYYGAYGVPVIYADFTTYSSITTIKGEAKVTTRVFETKGATTVYTVDTAIKNIESRDEGFLAITAAISERLHKDGLLR